MGRISFVRVAAIVSALFVASFILFPSFPNAGLLAASAPLSVDRAFKGDRLPLAADKIRAPASSAQAREKIPLGCDPAFSAISSPLLANIFRRCAA